MNQLVSAAIVLTWQVSFVLSHMSMQYPYPRDELSGTDYAVWQQNEPMWDVHPTICHGLDMDTSIRSGNAFSAGDFVTIDIYGSAPHDGGQCSFWWTTDETSDWYKIIDVIDCTLEDSFTVMLPYTMDTACESSCTFAWTWSPVSSGACEVYMNCAEISVSGVTGVDTSEAITLNIKSTIIDAANCERVDETTHVSPILGTSKTEYTTNDANGGATTDDAPGVTVVEVDEEVIEEEIESDPDALCTNPDATNLNGTISNEGYCGATYIGYRCDDGQCCSAGGYCGPDVYGYDSNGDAQYYDYDNQEYFASEDAAYAAYCDNNQGDWRLVSCDATPSPTSVTGGSDATASTTSVTGGSNPGESGAVQITFGMLYIFSICGMSVSML